MVLVASLASKSESNPVNVPVTVALILPAAISLLNSHLSDVALYVIVALEPFTVIPAPSASALSAALSASTMFLSLIVTVVEFTMVCVPSTCKLPLMTTLPVLSPTVLGSM